MNYEIFTNPFVVDEVKKFLRVKDTIYLGPANDGHRDIADYFNIDRTVKELKQESRGEVDGGFVSVDNKLLSIEFDNESGTYGLSFHQEARRGTVFIAQTNFPDHIARYKEIDSEQIAVTHITIQKPKQDPLWDREGESFYSTG